MYLPPAACPPDSYSPFPTLTLSVIDTIRSMDAEQPLGALRAVEAVAGRGLPGTRITYIYTGTSWSHSRGTGGLEAWSSEQSPPTAAYENDSWRRDVETAVLSSEFAGRGQRCEKRQKKPVVTPRLGQQLQLFILFPNS
jgi:hypothetical protein